MPPNGPLTTPAAKPSSDPLDEGTTIKITMKMLIKVVVGLLAALSFLYAADKRMSRLEDGFDLVKNENGQLKADLKASRESLQRLEVYVVRIETSLQYQLQQHTEPKKP